MGTVRDLGAIVGLVWSDLPLEWKIDHDDLGPAQVATVETMSSLTMLIARPAAPDQDILVTSNGEPDEVRSHLELALGIAPTQLVGFSLPPNPEGTGMPSGNDSDRYVEPNRERGGWDVKKENAQRASAHTSTKKQAVDRAREIVGNQGGGEIRIANKDGKFIDSDTVRGPKRGESPAKDTK